VSLCCQAVSLRGVPGQLPEIFNNDSTLTSALLDHLLHHAETVLIEGKSYRMKDSIWS
jgi:DNA replication protein DnaC